MKSIPVLDPSIHSFPRHIFRLPPRLPLLEQCNDLRLFGLALDMLLPLSKLQNHTQFCADLGEQVSKSAANLNHGITNDPIPK